MADDLINEADNSKVDKIVEQDQSCMTKILDYI